MFFSAVFVVLEPRGAKNAFLGWTEAVSDLLLELPPAASRDANPLKPLNAALQTRNRKE